MAHLQLCHTRNLRGEAQRDKPQKRHQHDQMEEQAQQVSLRGMGGGGGIGDGTETADARSRRDKSEELGERDEEWRWGTVRFLREAHH